MSGWHLVVVGGGMAGMTAAARVAEGGGRVLVLERAASIGGNALLSEGYLWTAPTFAVLRQHCPEGAAALQRTVVDEFPRVIEWIEGLDVPVSGPIEGILGYGRGHKVDIARYLDACSRIVTRAGGSIETGILVDSLLGGGHGVSGVQFRRAPEAAPEAASAPSVLLATGGWQGSAELLRRWVHDPPHDLYLRSNPASDGGGLRLAQQVGAATTPVMDTFYGHLVAAPLRRYRSDELLRLTQLHSEHSVVLNVHGRRFVDESIADHLTAQALVAQPGARGLLVADEVVRRDHATTTYLPGMEPIDKFRVALAAGANVATADSLEELASGVAEWGFDPAGTLATLRELNAGIVAAPDQLAPPYSRHPRPLDRPPLYALEVRPGITFTTGGVQIDERSRVLRPDGGPIPGLHAAGADGAGVYGRSYSGGLALATTYGFAAARTVGARRPVDAGARRARPGGVPDR